MIDQRGAESLARLADLPLRWISGMASDMGSSAAKSPPPKILSMLCQRGGREATFRTDGARSAEVEKREEMVAMRNDGTADLMNARNIHLDVVNGEHGGGYWVQDVVTWRLSLDSSAVRVLYFV